MNETAELAGFVNSLSLDQVPERTRAHARRLILDQLGCQLGSARLPWSQQVYQTIMALGSSGPSVIMAMGDLVRPDDAAFVNGTFGAANEIDDAHTGVRMHSGAVVVPAVLAVAQAEGVTDGAEVLTAAVAGYEVALRVAGAGFPKLMQKHHHSPVSAGPFGAAAATARLLGLDAKGTLHALAIAASHSGGLMEYTESGGSVKRIHTGIGSSSGVRAGYLAKHGVTGPYAALEGKRGFLEAFADRDNVGRLTEDLAETYLLDGIGPKNYFAEYRIHAPLQALEVLSQQHDLAFGDIERMRVGVTSVTVEAVGTITEPDDSLGAQFSMRFALALAAKHGARALREVTAQYLSDPEIIALAQRIDLYVDPELEARKWESFGAVLSVDTSDGRTLTDQQAAPVGMPANPMSDDQFQQKFRDLAEAELGQEGCEAVIQSVWKLEDTDVQADLIAFLVTS
jgi:2-methylcitrate dehydratase PrpD